MEAKCKSKAMTAILQRLNAKKDFEIIIFGDDCILNRPVDKWPACEVLNAAGQSGVGTVLKQGLRDQPEMLMTSDADEQLILTIPFSCAVKIKSITVVGSAAETGSNPAEMRAFINRDDVDFDVGSTPSNLTRTRTSHTCATQHVLLPPARYHSPAVLAPSDVAQHGPVAAAGRCQG